MTLALLVNGQQPANASQAIAVEDRGFQYGDGLFETMLLANGQVRFIDDHLQRLCAGCERLGIQAPDRQVLLGEIAQVCASASSGVVKIIVSRGAGGRGYRPTATAAANRVVALYPKSDASQAPLQLRWCRTRLGRNASLAGMKHLNRLEQVLAQREWQEGEADEGLMMDTEGELVCATAGNVFVIRDGSLHTSDLRFCGVRGVMRAQVLKAAARLSIAVIEAPLWPDDLQTVSEVFITNAVRGIRSAASLDSLQWSDCTLAQRLAGSLGLQ